MNLWSWIWNSQVLFNFLGIAVVNDHVCGSWVVSWLNGKGFSLKMLLASLALMIVGVFLMLQSLNMLFQMNPLSIVVLMLALLLVFSGIALILIALTGIAVAQ